MLISAGALAAMATAVPRAGALQDPATQEGGMVSLEALAHADKSVRGTYSFHVESAARTGDTNIEQDGAFSTAPGKPATLSAVTLDAKGGVYDARLELTVNSKREDLDTVSPRPLLFIAGDQAHSREFSELAFSKAAEPKELH
ncbi:hypothetical protein X743_10205 [Mesorhizobium sp. LNHC252B00]|nr:hypothetical protein X743_10205 [Mesorhizobium sp. LNHC252B00]